jgi:hypothetical protein
VAPADQADLRKGELPELMVADTAAWRTWLGEHHDQQAGIWLVLAKKGTTEPTSPSCEEVERAKADGRWDATAV